MDQTGFLSLHLELNTNQSINRIKVEFFIPMLVAILFSFINQTSVKKRPLIGYKETPEILSSVKIRL